MIVTCPECETGFQLDESRVPAKGIRVRCSRCKHAFHLAHPSASRSEAVDSIAAESVTGGGASTPSITQDLTSPDTPAASKDAPGADRSGGDEINNEDDAEWEFNHDVPAGDPATSDSHSRSAPEPALDTSSTSEPESPVFEAAHDGVESGLDLANDDGPSSGLDLDTGDDAFDRTGIPTGSAGSAAGVATASASASSGGNDFGSVDDFSSLMEDDDPLGSSSPVDDQGVADSLRASAKEAESVYSGAATSDELGDPESWDFFDDEGSSAPSPASPKAPIGRIALTSPGALDVTSTSGPGDGFDEMDTADEGWIRIAIESAGRIVGWTVVIVGLALGLVNGLWTTAESFVAGQRATALSDSIEAVDMRAQWVDTARSGRLLLVTGGLRNVSRSAARVPSPVEIVLLDRLGAPLETRPTAVGVELAERQIRELPIEVLASTRERAARQLLSSWIPAGGQLPFQAVVFEPPAGDGGLRFQVRLAEGGALSLPAPEISAGLDDQEFEAPDATASERADADEDRQEPVGRDQSVDAAAGDPIEAMPPATDPSVDPAAPGYDNPYGEESAGTGLQDL